MVQQYCSPVWPTHLLKHKYEHFKIFVFDPGHQEQQPGNYFLLQQGRPNLVKCTGEEKKMMIALSNAQLSITIVKQTLHEVSVFQNL